MSSDDAPRADFTFDLKAEFMSLAELEPMLRRVLSQPKNSIYRAAMNR